MGIKEKLESMGKNSIVLNIARKEKYKLCATRFGGQPDVPPDFEWPTFEGKSYDGVVKSRPLTFLAQFKHVFSFSCRFYVKGRDVASRPRKPLRV